MEWRSRDPLLARAAEGLERTGRAHMPRLEETVRLIGEQGLSRAARGAIERLLELSQGSGDSINELVVCVESDPILLARTLRYAADPACGATEAVTHAGQAIGMIGLRAAKIMTLSGIDGGRCRDGCIDRVSSAVRRRSVVRGVVARTAAHAVDYGRADSAATAGFLYEVGRLGALSLGGDPSSKLGAALDRANGELIARDVESSEFGAGGGELSAAVMREWNLCKDVALAVEVAGDLQHEPPGGEQWSIARAVRLGDEAAARVTSVADALPALVALAPRAERLLGIR
ncbi:MAG TPA: HDOD domain-containing protein, partial [Phycisphaerales bacterium]|nr:HDOD domain-containing protein [Phycisphaerales bacterium]